MTDAQSAAAVARFALRWSRAVAHANFVPGGRARARDTLRRLTADLAGALTAAELDPAVGYRVGRDLVHGNLATPRALGITVGLLGRDLLPELGIDDPVALTRLAVLLEELTVGFTETLRDRMLAAAESINRAERDAWRGRQRQLQDDVQHALLHDALTGLPNRAALTRRLAASGAERRGLCLVKLHRFTTVHDSFGAATADRLLLDAADRLGVLAAQREHFLAHLGGNTFALLVEGTQGPDDAGKAADAALRALPEPWRIDGHDIPMSVRAGVAEGPRSQYGPAELIQAAATAMRWACHDRLRPYALFEADRNAAQLRRHEITNALPAAVARDAFTLAYQPLVRLADGVVVGVEALARWRHPTLGPVAPAEFIGLAEDLGLIDRLGRQLLGQACARAATWSDRADAPLLSVNLAVPQLDAPDLVAAVAAVLHETGLPPARLQLEITENALLDQSGGGLETLDGLARCGVKLAIDDFGTGYANLANLVDLPVGAVKLAARFLDGFGARLPLRRSGEALVAGLIELIHGLELTVTAEGVATAEQAARLRDYGCDLGQGFHLGRPLSPAAADALFRA
jgi:diguanylate cyclase (GGDEF)-like protein